MELSGSQLAWSRRVLAVAGLAAVVSAASLVAVGPDRMAADPVALALNQAQPDGMTFNDADRLFVYFQIAPEQGSDFELVLTKMKEALTGSAKPERQAQAKGLKVIKMTDLQAGALMYVFQLDPVVKDVSYDPFKILGESLPADDVRQLYEKVQPGLKGISRAAYTEVVRGGMN